MYEMREKIRDPLIVLLMGIDERIESATELIMADKDIPKKDIQKLTMDKESLIEIFHERIGKSKEINYDKLWSANNLINKIDYILEMYNMK